MRDHGAVTDPLTRQLAAAVSQGAAERRRKRSRVPVVGPHGAVQVRLSPRLKDMLLRQATRRIERATDPLITNLQAQLPALRQAFRSERRSIEGANEAAADAVAGIELDGLRGQARRQVADEMASRQADILASTPFLVSDARQSYQQEKSTLLSDIATAKAEQQSGIAEAFNSLLDKATTDAQSTVKAQRKTQAEHKPGSEAQRQLNLALSEAKRLLTAFAGQIPDTESGWQRFAGEVAKADGLSDPRAVQEAIDRIKKILERDKTPFAQGVNAATAGRAAAGSTARMLRDAIFSGAGRG